MYLNEDGYQEEPREEPRALASFLNSVLSPLLKPRIEINVAGSHSLHSAQFFPGSPASLGAPAPRQPRAHARVGPATAGAGRPSIRQLTEQESLESEAARAGGLGVICPPAAHPRCPGTAPALSRGSRRSLAPRLPGRAGY